MSFLRPRTISVYRAAVSTAPGLQAYNAPNDEKEVATGIAASIQLKKETGTQPTHLPGDASKRTFWRIMFQGAPGLVQDTDTIVDDLGLRYQVIGAYWNSLGYACLCERLEA